MTTQFRKTCLIGAWITAMVAPAFAAPQSGSSFFDPFRNLSSSRWFISNGWANGSHQSCLWHRNRVEIVDGKLLLSLENHPKQDRDFSCGEVQTNDRLGYGTFEARMKVPYARGMNANMFTFIGAPQNRPHNEIDFEFIARNGPTLQTNFHFQGNSDNADLHFVPDDGVFRDYAFIWEPGRIRWYIDGTLIREARGDGLPDEPQKMYLSIWSTDTLKDWMGVFQAKSAPKVLEVEWAAYTELGSPCAFEQSLLCRDGVDTP